MSQFPIVVELGIESGWVDVTKRLRGDSVVIERGRSDEASRPSPVSTQIQLDNSDGNLTPGDPRSIWYPAVTRGMPVRISRHGGVKHLVVSDANTNRALASDHASFDVTDLWVAWEGVLDNWHDFAGTDAVSVIDRWGSAGNRSWALYVDAGTIGLTWSTDGTATQATTSAFVPVSSDGRMAIAAHIDVNNGAGGHDVTFYIGRRLDDLEQLGDTFTGAGTTSIFAGSAAITVGRQAFANQGFRAYKAQVRNGDSAGTVVVNPDFTAQTAGATAFTDSAGRSWAIQGTAKIDDIDIRFLGQADRFEMAWPQARPRGSPIDGAAVVTVDASVSLRRMLQGVKPLDSTLRRLLSSPSTADLVVDYWPFEDGRNAGMISSGLPGGRLMRIRGDYTMAADDSFPASSPLLSISSGANAYMSAPIRAIPRVAGVEWEITRFFRIDTPVVSPATATQLMAVDTDGTVATWRLTIDDTAVIISGVDSDGTGVVLDDFPSDDRFFNTWAMIVLEIVDDGANVDWAVSVIPIPGGIVFGTSGTFVGNTGVPGAFRNSLTGPPSGISVGHLIVTSGASIGWLAGADTAWEGETSAHRFWRLLSEEQMPMSIMGDPNVRFSFRGDPLRSELMGPQLPAPLLTLLQECVTADGGRMVERRDVTGLCFRTRQTMLNQDPAVTLNVAASALREPFTPILDDQAYRNEITASRPNAGEATVATDPAPDPSDLYDDSVEVNVFADAQLPDQASWRLHLASTETLRYPALSTSMGRSGAGLAWSQSEVGDKVEVANLMDQLVEDDEILIEGSRETFDFYRWIVDVNGSPAGPWDVAVREDTVRGRRDHATTALSLPITATSTDAPIDNLSWTQASGDFPFDLDIGGERVTATGFVVFGSYVFNVVRSVNGVVKAHAAGTSVRLWHPAVRSL